MAYVTRRALRLSSAVSRASSRLLRRPFRQVSPQGKTFTSGNRITAGVLLLFPSFVSLRFVRRYRPGLSARQDEERDAGTN